MRFSISSSIAQQIRSQTERVQKRLQAERPTLLEELGTQLLSNALIDYRTKARGGTGTDGIAWKPLAESTEKKKGKRGSQKKGRKTKSGKSLPGPGKSEIGVDTGLQRASASPGFTGGDGKGGNLFETDENSVTVGFNREYSVYFDESRKLLPEKLPTAWQEELDKIVTVHLERIVSQEID